MKTLLSNLVILLSFSLNLSAQNHVFEWATSAGGMGKDYSSCITTDAAGNVYTAGYFEGLVDFDPGIGISQLYTHGGKDIFIQKVDSTGILVWVKQIGGLGDDEAMSISIDANGYVYTTGYYNDSADFNTDTGTTFLSTTSGSNIFLQKMDAAGNFLWAKQTGSLGNDFGRAITTDVNGNVYVTGRFFGSVDFDPDTTTSTLSATGGSDIFVEKFDAFGNFSWAKKMGGSTEDEGWAITTDLSGNVYTTGVFRGVADFDPNAGTFYLASAGGRDIFIQKLSSSGTYLWAKRFGSSNDDGGKSITIDFQGNLLIAGNFMGTSDFDPGIGTSFLSSAGARDVFVQKLDNSGNLIWVKQFGGNSNDYGQSMSTDTNGNIYLTGSIWGTADFDPGPGTYNLTPLGTVDIFIQKLDTLGDFIWAKQIGGSGKGVGQSITTDNFENIYTTGYFNNSIDFNPGSGTLNLTRVGDWDIFTQKMTLCKPVSATDIQTVCDSLTWIDGITYSSNNNTATHNILGGASTGCDSMVTLDLTVISTAQKTDSIIACESYTWINGLTYRSNNNLATYIILAGASTGCDSIVTLDLTILPKSSGTDSITSCKPITWIDGGTYSSSFSGATFTINGGASNGCDSLVFLDLTINGAFDTTTSLSGLTITSNEHNSTYQWLNCDSNYSAIPGDTNISFTATANGNYAVQLIDINGCIDTSACVAITDVGLWDGAMKTGVHIFPNPTDGDFAIQFDNTAENVVINIYNTSGQLLQNANHRNADILHLKLNQPAGVYLIEVSTTHGKETFRLIK